MLPKKEEEKGIGQVFEAGGKRYNVEKLWEISKKLPVEHLALEDAQTYLDTRSWSGNKSPREILKDRDNSHGHFGRVLSANLDYPILMAPNSGIIDGMHRIAKAHKEDAESLPIRRFTSWEDMSPALMHEAKTAEKKQQESVAPGEKLAEISEVRPLTTPAERRQAAALERRVFCPDSKYQNPRPYSTKKFVSYGIFDDDKLVAATRVQLNPDMARWAKGPYLDELKKLNPEIAISATMVDPEYRRQGLATQLRDHLKERYDRILTGTGPKSDPSMPHINEAGGFKNVMSLGKNTQWYWSRDQGDKTAELAEDGKHKLQGRIDFHGLSKTAGTVRAYVTGPSGGGKTTYVHERFPEEDFTHVHLDRYSRTSKVEGAPRTIDWGAVGRDIRNSTNPVVIEGTSLHKRWAQAAEERLLVDPGREQTAMQRLQRDRTKNKPYSVGVPDEERLRIAYDLYDRHYLKRVKPKAEQLGFTRPESDLGKTGTYPERENLGMKTAEKKEEERSEGRFGHILRKALPVGAGALAAVGAYKGLRKFRPSAIPELRALQEQAKDLPMEIATSHGVGRNLRSMLFGAHDIPVDQVTQRASTVLRHSMESGPTHGSATINAGVLPEALDDKYIFSRVMEGGTGGAKGMPGSIPETHLLADRLQEVPREYLNKAYPNGYVIKPRTGSMSKAENLLTEATDPTNPRLQEALQHPRDHIIQEKIPIQQEYRVHMVNNVPFTATYRQLPEGRLRDLWNKYMGGGGGAFLPVMGDDREKLMSFARDATKHIGDTETGNILGKTEHLHHAVDIARLPDGSFRAIESNPVPGTLMNPITARKLQYMVTGRVPKDVSALGALGAGATVAGVGSRLMNGGHTEDEEKMAALNPALVGLLAGAPIGALGGYVSASDDHKAVGAGAGALAGAGLGAGAGFALPLALSAAKSRTKDLISELSRHAVAEAADEFNRQVPGMSEQVSQNLAQDLTSQLPGFADAVSMEGQRVLPEIVQRGAKAMPSAFRHMFSKKAELAEDGKHKLQGRVDFQGLNIAVENQKGSVRSGTTPDGHKWRTVMKSPYGYIDAPAKGKDGDSLDVYVGPDKKAPYGFVVHQHKPDGTGHDEDKVILGTKSEEEAKKLYLKHYDDPRFLGPISKVPVARIKELVQKPGKIEKLSALQAIHQGIADQTNFFLSKLP